MKELRYPTRARQCSSCIFRDNQVVTPQRLDEIRSYLLTGKTHICHTSADKACRGGRKYQAQMWHRMGLLKHNTIHCLETTVVEVLNKPE